MTIIVWLIKLPLYDQCHDCVTFCVPALFQAGDVLYTWPTKCRRDRPSCRPRIAAWLVDSCVVSV